MIYDPRELTPVRYHILLASKPTGKKDHGRVWWVDRTGDGYVLTEEGQVKTVTSIVEWLKQVDYARRGPARKFGGFYVIPTETGLQVLEAQLRRGATEKEKP